VIHRRLRAADVGLHDFLVVIGERLVELVAPVVGRLPELLGDRPVLPLLALALVRPDVRHHRDEVDDADEVVLGSHRQLDRDGV
jgi:hypothetical protein